MEGEGLEKTAILQMVNHTINNNNEKEEFQLGKIVRKQDHLRLLTMSLRPFEDALNKGEMVHVTKCIFKWLIYLNAMLKVAKSNKIPNSEAKRRLKKYLESKQLLKNEKVHISNSPITIFVDLLAKYISKSDIRKGDFNAAILWTIRDLENQEYLDALNDVISILNSCNKSCMILIDSQERYAFDDTIFANSITGLIEAVLEIDKDYKSTSIKAKVAFPSEIVPHMSPENKGSQNTKSHFIFWKYDDIVRLIYKRYKLLLDPNSIIEDIEDNNSLKSIYELIPPKIVSYSNIEHDTLSYVINHTQKKTKRGYPAVQQNTFIGKTS